MEKKNREVEESQLATSVRPSIDCSTSSFLLNPILLSLSHVLGKFIRVLSPLRTNSSIEVEYYQLLLFEIWSGVVSASQKDI